MKRDQHIECGVCNSKDHWLLHNIPQRGIYRRFCTHCVLKLNPGLFCPKCFVVYEGSSPPPNGVTCLKCLSVSHVACISRETTSRYVCPTCLNPNNICFDSNKKSNKDGSGESSKENELAIDLNKAKVLHAAARIASVLMNKAATAARIEAEKRVKEAALTRKKAKEALEELNFLSSRDKERDGNEMMRIDVVPNIPSPVVVEDEQKKKSRGNSAVAAAVAAQKRFQMNLNDGKDRDKSVEGQGVLDNAALREKEMSVGSNAPNIVQKPHVNGVMGYQQRQSPVAVKGKEKTSNFSQSKNGVVQGEKKNGLVSVIHGVEGNQEKSKEFGDVGVVPQLTHPRKGAFVPKTNEGVSLPTGSSKTAS